MMTKARSLQGGLIATIVLSWAPADVSIRTHARRQLRERLLSAEIFRWAHIIDSDCAELSIGMRPQRPGKGGEGLCPQFGYEQSCFV